LSAPAGKNAIPFPNTEETYLMATPRFSLGRTVATPGALEALDNNQQTEVSFLCRHQNGDWGDLDEHDRAANDRAITEQERILSGYRLPDGTRIWVITEADRSSTCILLPEEY
jgi:hypothetical protein